MPSVRNPVDGTTTRCSNGAGPNRSRSPNPRTQESSTFRTGYWTGEQNGVTITPQRFLASSSFRSGGILRPTARSSTSFSARFYLADAVELAFEIAGYCLWPAAPLRRAVMLLGGGRNGKSTFLGLLRALLG